MMSGVAGATIRGNAALPSLLVLAESLVLVADSFTNVTGRTFVFNTATAAYEPDDARTDAPPQGTRFILYAADLTTRTLMSPLTEVGYVDVRPAAAPGGHAVTAVIGGDTAFDWVAFGTSADSSFMDCCSWGVLGAPRTLRGSGRIWRGSVPVPFEYADTITVEGAASSLSYVGDLRQVHLVLPGLGTLDVQSYTGTSFQPVNDADYLGHLTARFPIGGGSAVVVLAFRGTSGTAYLIDSITVNGRVLCYHDAYGQPADGACPAHIASLLDAEWLFAHGPRRVQSLEAILAPAVFGLR